MAQTKSPHANAWASCVAANYAKPNSTARPTLQANATMRQRLALHLWGRTMEAQHG
jgi:hypothetical protein